MNNKELPISVQLRQKADLLGFGSTVMQLACDIRMRRNLYKAIKKWRKENA